MSSPMFLKLLVLFLLAAVAAGFPIDLVPINWSNVPTSTPAARNLNSPYLGECVCDVTWGVCDPHCCCDTDCTAETISSFSHCLPTTFSSPYLDYCYPKDRATSLKKINNIDATYIDKRMQGYSAVCVIRANHPSELYRYFQVPTSVKKPAITTPAAITVGENQSYSVGDALLFAKLTTVDGAGAYRSARAIQIPVMTVDGSCSSFGRGVGFLDPVRGVTCAASGAQICSAFPMALFTNLFLQPTPYYSYSGTELVPIKLTILSVDGTVLATLDASDTSSGSSYASAVSGSTCSNAITALVATFTYSGNESGTITAAAINITLADVGISEFAAVTFQASFAAENILPPEIIISGTPGYLPGYKVRAGTLVTSDEKSAILERKSGFAVPSGGRLCSSGQWKQVGFMYSVLSSGCVVSMSESELLSICATGTENTIQALINTTVGGFGTIFDRIAMTNDALTNDTTSWIEVQGLTEALSLTVGTYDEYSRACKGVTVGLHYQFVVARAGSEYNPQDVIVGAFVSATRGSLRIQDQTDFTTAATSYQQFSFKATFSRYDPDSQGTIRRRVIAPPILPRLDNTIFYPFRSPYPL